MDIRQLRERLEQRRGSLGQIAEAANIDRRTISRIINDEDYLPNLRTMLALDAALSRRRPVRQKEAA